MSAPEGDDERSRARLSEANAALDAQVRELVRRQQRLFVSERESSRQLARIERLNTFAFDAIAADDPEGVLVLAATLVFDFFGYEQFMGFLADERGSLFTAAHAAVEGRETASDERLASVRAEALVCQLPPGPLFGAADVLSTHPGARGAVSLLARAFDADPATPASGAMLLALPIRDGDVALGLMVFRRLDPDMSFHDELASTRSRAFLDVLARKISATVANATRVRDLAYSYEALAKAQAALVDRERLAALGELTAVVAHEVRNPLGAIVNSLAILRRLTSSSTEVEAVLGIAEEEAGRIESIVSELVAFVRPHSPELYLAAVDAIVERAIASVRATYPQRHFRLAGGGQSLAPVRVDEQRLHQALVNLLANAADAGAAGTPVTVTLIQDMGCMKIDVEDHGPGISEAVRARLFEPFFTTKAKGSGLGLAVVKRVLEEHGGEVLVASGPSGSTFTLRLPR